MASCFTLSRSMAAATGRAVGGPAQSQLVEPKGAVRFGGQRLWVAPVGGGGAADNVPRRTAGSVHWGEAEFVAGRDDADGSPVTGGRPTTPYRHRAFDEAPVGVVTRGRHRRGGHHHLAAALSRRRHPQMPKCDCS